MKLGRIEVRETICRFLYRTWSAEGAFRRPLRSLQRVACALQCTPIQQRMDRARFLITAPPIAMRDKDARSVLLGEDTLQGCHIIMEGRLRLGRY
jgi:hypothetical protein